MYFRKMLVLVASVASVLSAPAYADDPISALLDSSVSNRFSVCNAACAFYSEPYDVSGNGQWVYVSIDDNPTPGIWNPFNNPNLNFNPRPASQQACVQAARNACQYFQNYPDQGRCNIIRLYRTVEDRWGRPNALLRPAVVRCR
jgi:hypothetical protein